MRQTEKIATTLRGWRMFFSRFGLSHKTFRRSQIDGINVMRYHSMSDHSRSDILEAVETDGDRYPHRDFYNQVVHNCKPVLVESMTACSHQSSRYTTFKGQDR